MSFLSRIFGEQKKIAKGSFGTVYKPNYACPNFKVRKGYISKMVKASQSKVYKNEISILKQIKKIDPKQKSLASFETTCASSTKKYKHNIIMKNFGISMMDKKYKLDKTYTHVINVYLKQILEALMLLHKNGIYHKDVHDRNTVYSEEENRYRLIDFGLSVSAKEIDEIFKMSNIKKSKQLNEHFDNAVVRGDGYQETFDIDGYRDLEDIVFAEDDEEIDMKKIKKLNLKSLASQLKKAHQDADVSIILSNAPFLAKNSKNKGDKKKIEDLLNKIIKSKKLGTLTAKYVYDKLFPKKGGAKKRRVVKKKKSKK